MFARASAFGMTTKTMVAAAATLAMASVSSAVTCPTVGEELPAGIYVASANGELWRVNPMKRSGTAVATFVGELRDDKQGFYPTDIAFNDDGSLYGVDGFELFCLNPTTASVQQIGRDDFNPPWQTGLAGKTNSLGQLFGAGEDRLFQIQVQSGKSDPTALEFGPLSCGSETGDLVFDPDREVLFGTVDCVGAGLGDRSHLVVINPTTGAMEHNIGPITDTTGRPRYGVFGLAYGPDGALYAGAESTLMRIDPLTGKSLEDFNILSGTTGKFFDRVDGMASRVCEGAAAQADHPHRRTAGQWRQQCPDLAYAQIVDPQIAYVSDGLVTTACDALNRTASHHPVTMTGAVQAPQAVLADAETAVGTGRRALGARVGGRTEVALPAEQATTNGGGSDTLCSLGLREFAAAALNIASGRYDAACPDCDHGNAGAYVEQLGEQLRQAMIDGDAASCNEVKRLALHVAGGNCPGK